MAEIIATFDTKDKKLTVTKDGKKVQDVSEIEFYSYGDTGSVELRSAKYDEENSFVTITKIIASEDGGYTEETVDEPIKQTADLARALFPHKTL